MNKQSFLSIVLALSVGVLAFACGEADAPATPPAATSGEPTVVEAAPIAEAVPIPEEEPLVPVDFEEPANAELTAENLVAEVERLEADLGEQPLAAEEAAEEGE